MEDQPFTASDQMAVCVSRQIIDGELVAQGIATPMVTAGILLAKLTHAPNISFVSAIGQAVCQDWAPIGLSTIEELWIKKGLLTVSLVDAAADMLPRLKPKEFFRPGQVDAYGSFNNVFIGRSYEHPRLRLPGSGGIPDVTVYGDKIYLYVPRHGRHTFVKELDFKSGLGHAPEKGTNTGPKYLISDLGQFDFDQVSGRMRIMSLHPGVSLSRVLAKTGFDLQIPDDLKETAPPTANELYLLRSKIDPLGVRELETLAGSRRKEKMRQILHEERQSR